MNQLWSWLLMAVGVTGLYYAGRRMAVGWAIGLFAQTLWALYAVTTGQYGFLVSAAVYGWMYGKNWLSWRPEKPRDVPGEHSSERHGI